MKRNYAKLFIDNSNKVIKVDYSPSTDDYYGIVKKNCNMGYKQIIITSKLMIKLIKEYIYNTPYNITAIDFMESDVQLNNEISLILNKLNSDRAYLGLLLEKLKFLSEESAIDIRSIELIGTNANKESVNIYIQVNGIFAINEKRFNQESQLLINMIERCLK